MTFSDEQPLRSMVVSKTITINRPPHFFANIAAVLILDLLLGLSDL
jgi:hypothetical protein